MLLIEKTARIRDMLEDERGDAAARAKNASQMATKASKRGDKPARVYWAGVYARAKAQLAAAAGQSAKTSGDHAAHGKGGKAPAGGERGSDATASASNDPAQQPPEKAQASPSEKGGIVKRMSALLHKAARSTSTGISALGDQIKKLPEDAQRLIQDPEFRKQSARKAANHVKKIPAKVLYHAVEEVEEVVRAGGVLLKAAARKPLDDHDRHLLKIGAKALVTTVLGTVAMGGIAHLTAQALATHFAAEAAVKSIGKAALYAAAMSSSDEAKATLVAWAQNVMHGVQVGFATMGTMPPEEMVAVLSGEKNAEDEKAQA